MKTQRMLIIGACLLGFAALPAVADDKSKDDKFKMMDADGDGRISQSEHTQGAQKMFAKFDTNADGKVTRAEVGGGAGAARSDGSGHSDKGQYILDECDQNNDGQVTTSEHQMSASSKFTEMDANRDGFITKDEMAAGHKRKHDRN
ncbi:MAG TPA: EF-hand domain-containing protein [Opitutaceae bacterium]|nr:EF-hand domain-containing protein [Opitutaceae bacterium]